MAHVDDKAALIARLDKARSRIAANGYELADDLNVPAKLKKSLQNHRGIWIAATAVVGLVLVKIPARTKKVFVDRKGRPQKDLEKVEKAGLLVGAAKIAFDLAKPLLIRFGKALVLQAIERRRAKQGYGTPHSSQF